MQDDDLMDMEFEVEDNIKEIQIEPRKEIEEDASPAYRPRSNSCNSDSSTGSQRDEDAVVNDEDLMNIQEIQF